MSADRRASAVTAAATAGVVVSGVALAGLLGAGDAANASAALVSARSGSYRRVAAWSVGWHLVGGLLAGTAVARTVVGIVHVRPDQLAATLASASLASVLFTWVATRRGLPASASVGLVGGLAGAGVVAGGWGAVSWGHVPHGLAAPGVVGVLAGVLLAPVVGAVVAGAVAAPARRLSFRLRRTVSPFLGAGTWLAAAAVALADGTNDGQKAMGVLAAGLSGASAVHGASGIAWWVKVVCAVVLAAGTVVGGRRLLQTVARGLAPAGTVDDLVSQVTSAGVILLAAAGGLPLSTSAVTTSTRVGAGIVARRRHVRWLGVVRILVVWLITVPACGVIGAGLYGLLRAVGG